jgi:SCY1-like protein 2
MKGLTSVLDRFSEGLRVRKVLPSLVEEVRIQLFSVESDFTASQMKDVHLLPYILPNVFAIATIVTPQQFATLILPSLKPLFTIREPPQNMLTLLDNLNTLQEKTEKTVFRERMSSLPFCFLVFSVCALDVLPLVYNALESEHAPVRSMVSFLPRVILSRLGPRTCSWGCTWSVREY